MKVTEAEFVKGFIRLCDDGFKQNWHERNGGNLSYRIKPESMAADRNQRSEAGRRVFHGNGKWKILPQCNP